MDLALAPEHKAFADEIRDFTRKNLSPATREKTFSGKHYDRDDHMVWQQALGRQGWLGYTWPKKFGGPGWDVTRRFLFENVLAEEGAPRIMPFGPKMVGPVIYTFGDDEQKERFLHGIRASTVAWCQGYSEPGAGSDLASLRTRAELQGDHYIVNGQKTWTSYAHWGDWIFCLVRTSTEGKPQEGISFLLIDMKTPGVTVRPIIMLDGAHAVNDVFLDNVKVPVANRIGKENEGWTCAKFLLANERLGIAEVPASKRGVGMLRAISDDPSMAEKIADVNRTKRELERLKRIARAEGVYDDTRFRDEVAKLEVDVIALEMLVLRVLAAETSGKQSLDIAGLLKIRGSEIQQRYSELMMLAAGPFAMPWIREAMEAGWQGDAVGALHCAPLAATYLNMRKTTIYGGSNEVQRNIVSQVVLG
ncbi:MAG: acyl-CoA dehydrogenase family protein [Alphaproteobacteria bacterium]|nr:acyl-CoA dehydrogenase family protein [Alphaproteobacteria bacterium]